MPDRGDLVLVPYPFTDLSASKRRPVLVLTKEDAYGDFIGLPVTSRSRSDNVVALTQQCMKAGVLPAPSWIRTDRIVTLSAALVIKTVGKIAEQVVNEAAHDLCRRICP